MRILITGADGQLGKELVATVPRLGHTAVGMSRSECDITSVTAVRRALLEHRPDVVVNCAAYTRVDAAETEVDQAYRVNAFGPRVLAAESHAAHAVLCHVSTDYVFDGQATEPYTEWDKPNPLSVYGASKLAGEREVQTLCPDHVILRTSWLYGQNGPNFVTAIRSALREDRPLRVVDDQWGSPTWTRHLAASMVQLLERGARGLYHLAGGPATTWHALAEEIARHSGRADVPVERISTSDLARAAPRPRFSALATAASGLVGLSPFPPWQEAVHAYLAFLDALQEGHSPISRTGCYPD